MAACWRHADCCAAVGELDRGQTQDMGVGSHPTPVCRLVSPWGTRTPNPLMKSQGEGGEIARTLIPPGVAPQCALANPQSDRMIEAGFSSNSLVIPHNAQDLPEMLR